MAAAASVGRPGATAAAPPGGARSTSAAAGAPAPNEPAAGYRYHAFISYRHHDADRGWARWLHGALERYRTPARLVARGAPPHVRPVFRDEEELGAAGDLSARVREALRQSRFLIVVCSPRARASPWVDAEVRYFRALGRPDRVLALLVEGEPAAAFPPALLEHGPGDVGDASAAPGPLGRAEPLAADVRPRPGERARPLRALARLRLLAPLLGCTFDELHQREQERQRRRWMALSAVLAGVLAVVAALAFTARVQWRRAEAEAARAQARFLAAQAQAELAASASAEALGTAGRARAALLALESLRLEPSVVGDRALRAAVDALTDSAARVPLAEGDSVLAVAADGALAVVASDAGARLWRRGGPAAPLPGGARLARFSPDGRLVAVAGPGGLRLWRTDPPAPLAAAPAAGDSLGDLRFAPGAGRLRFRDGARLAEWDWRSGAVRVLGRALGAGAALSPDGRWVASPAPGDSVAVEAADGAADGRRLAFAAGPEAVPLAVDAGGVRVAVAQGDDVVVWDAAARRPVAVLPHEWRVAAARFAPGGARLATVTGVVSVDAADPDATTLVGSTVRVWDLADARERTRVSLARDGGLHGPVFGDDGRLLVGVLWTPAGPVLRRFPLWPEELRRAACAAAGRNLGAPEARAYLGRAAPPVTCPGLPVPDDDGAVEPAEVRPAPPRAPDAP
jgi:hypothetical protein